MTKVRVLLLAIGLPLFLVGLFGVGKLIQSSQGKVFAGPDIISPTPFNTNIAASGLTALLTKESGEVSYKLPNTEEFKPLDTDEINLPTETTIKTGSDSLAHVVFPDNSLMSLSKNTEVILRFEEKKINIFQIFGNTWHRVESVLQGHEYSVETPSTLATVRGTEFNVGVDETGDEVYVMESVVDVSKIKKVGDEIKIEETQKVTQDKHVFMKEVDADKPLKVVDLPAEKKKSDWFLRNSKLTEQIKKAEAEEEKKEGIQQITGTPATGDDNRDSEKKDKIKHRVRQEIMKGLGEEAGKVIIPTTTPITTGRVQGAKTEKENTTTKPNSTTTPTTSRLNTDSTSVQPTDKPTATLTKQATTENLKEKCKQEKNDKLASLKTEISRKNDDLKKLREIRNPKEPNSRNKDDDKLNEEARNSRSQIDSISNEILSLEEKFKEIESKSCD